MKSILITLFVLVLFATLLLFGSCTYNKPLSTLGWEYTVVDTTHTSYAWGSVEKFDVIIEIDGTYYSALQLPSGELFNIDRRLNIKPCNPTTDSTYIRSWEQ